MFEVELKFPVTEIAPLMKRFAERGAIAKPAVQQTDIYFNHPVRDFAETDEALRIRTTDGRHCITYKGPLVDATTKTRREIEIPFGTEPTDGDRFTEILRMLGFRKVRPVHKTRIPYHFTWEDRPVEICVDDVAGLGTFIELEMMAGETALDATRDSLWRMAKDFGLENSERRSYLRLLLENDNP